MKIIDELIKPYYIESDGINYNVMEDTGRENKSGSTMKKLHGHYSNVESALNKISKLIVEKDVDKDTEKVFTIKEYIEELKTIKIKITN